MDVFPYRYRRHQRDIVDFVKASVSHGCTAVMESPTGTGKTVCSLSGVLSEAMEAGRKVLFLTRTKSQQRQVISELRAISKRAHVFGVAMQGRTPSTCPSIAGDPELSSGSSEELSKYCSAMKKEECGTRGCEFFDRMCQDGIDDVIDHMRRTMPEPEELQEYCAGRGICPYETAKAALTYADAIAVPYSFFAIPDIRRRLEDWGNFALQDVTVIVDEAHNLPDYLRDVMTSEYTMRALDLAEKEAREWNDPLLCEGIRATMLTAAIGSALAEAVEEFVVDEDAMLPPYYLQDALMGKLGATSASLERAYRSLVEMGEVVTESKKARRKLPRSYMGSLGRFLQFWGRCEDEIYVKLVNGGENPSFEAYCMDPSPAAEPFRICHSSVHMSGTMGPLDEYVSELDLRRAKTQMFESPFDPGNLRTVHATDVTTKFGEFDDRDNRERMVYHIVSLIRSVDRNTAVFFPSYRIMDDLLSLGLSELIGRPTFMESRGMDQSELTDEIGRFRSAEGAVLFAVSGGRVSEGIDFPDRELEMAVIIGIPYAFMSVKQKALVRYTDIRLGNGWERIVRAPAVRKMRQARGRLIRSDTDRGFCAVLDRRAAGLKGFDASPSENPAGDAVIFFSGKNN
ncbi:MAG: ATP-dependent DNA helicase [Candidatus Methanomethylophilaceae archaeon]|jgi:DNA excision repair protein ERCC-2|nr:hypothetical protein AOA81_01835 [Methanomassiliicoccales archaeon RumEn M2]MDD3127667.1 ATP-dependent DNA helicase [Candidatus Methanomethylophilaceae archaeon]MDD4119138.1 ATP-dependent DNA helicase [Candidatus Methanomethylophilaceae archaeon]MDD4453766.1 ATP-dependent DNA helicase [Candidatus Methanomethylophilaceae archaeon]MDI9378153.1 ATP-dependent DNA helicase [Candidatus Thermoplasmatota archaeon]